MQTTFFYLERFLKKWADDQCSSTVLNICITLYHSSWLIRNLMFNGSIYYVLYLQILHFYFIVRQKYRARVAFMWHHYRSVGKIKYKLYRHLFCTPCHHSFFWELVTSKMCSWTTCQTCQSSGNFWFTKFCSVNLVQKNRRMCIFWKFIIILGNFVQIHWHL